MFSGSLYRVKLLIVKYWTIQSNIYSNTGDKINLTKTPTSTMLSLLDVGKVCDKAFLFN